MNLREMIEAGNKKAGEQKLLAHLIGVKSQQLTDAKSGRAGIPDASCVKLAQVLGMPWQQVIAARNEWTAKTEEEREFWHPFVLGRAAGLLVTTAIIAATALPSETQAAQGFSNNRGQSVVIMSNRLRQLFQRAIKYLAPMPLSFDF